MYSEHFTIALNISVLILRFTPCQVNTWTVKFDCDGGQDWAALNKILPDIDIFGHILVLKIPCNGKRTQLDFLAKI